MKSSAKIVDSVFNPARLRFLIVRDVFLSGRSMIITSVTLFLVIVVISILNNLSRHSGFSHFSNFLLILIIAGYVISAKAFIDIHSKSRAYEWFMLPASLFEKFVARLIITSVGWAVLFTVLYSLASVTGESLNLVLFGYRHDLFNPFSKDVFFVILHYLITQSVFLFGAVYFRKNHFIKTVLSILLVGIGFVLVSLLIWRVFFVGYFPSLFTGDGAEHWGMGFNWVSFNYKIEGVVKAVWVMIRIVYYVFFAPFFWLLSCIRLAETEVRNGV